MLCDNMQFYDLCVRSQAGISSVSELAKQALLLGYSGIVVIEPWHGVGSLQNLKKEVTAERTAELEVLAGVELQPKTPAELGETLELARPEAGLIVVSGGDLAVNRAACEDQRVDLLLPNMDRPDGGLDASCYEAATKSGVAVGLCFRNALITFRKQRSTLLGRLAIIVNSAQVTRTQLVAISGARSSLGDA